MPPFENITSGRLITFIDKAWDHREIILEKIKASLPVLKKRAQQINTLLIEELSIVVARKGQDPNMFPGIKSLPY